VAASLPDWHFEYLLQGETLFEIGFGLCLTSGPTPFLVRREDVVNAKLANQFPLVATHH